MTKEELEKEAEDFAIKECCLTCSIKNPYSCEEKCECWIFATEGVKFGYSKANEWHYVNWKYFADKDCPKSELSSYLVQLKNKDFLICDWEMEEGFGCFWDSNLNPIDNDDVSAWKEIVLPKESD